MTKILPAAPSRKSNYLPRNGRDVPARQQFNAQVRLCEVAPSGVPGEFKAIINGELVIPSSRVPLLDAARALLAGGADPNGWLIMRHAGSDTDCLRGKIGVLAQLAVRDNNYGTPKLRRMAPAGVSLAAPVRQSGAA